MLLRFPDKISLRGLLQKMLSIRVLVFLLVLVGVVMKGRKECESIVHLFRGVC